MEPNAPKSTKPITDKPSVKAPNKKLLTVIIAVLIAIGCIALVFALYTIFIKGTSQTQTTSKKEVNALTIYHWWTSAGEAAAVASLVDGFSKLYPDVAIMSAPVKSGNVDFHEKVLKPMVFNNEAPDSFQGHPGYEIKPYYDSGTLEIVGDIWQSENLETIIPKAIQDVNKFKGDYYSIPIGVHRGNVVWYNKSVLTKAGIDATKLTDWDSFFKACDTLKANGVTYPIQMGEAWTQAHVFESIMASGGSELYQDLANGKITSSTDARVIQAFETFKKFLTYTNTDSAKTSWNDAVGRVIKGESAFNVMGDWANGEFKIVGMKYNKDYGSFALPGTGDIFVLNVDTFVQPKGTAHPTNSIKWLKYLASREGQDAFNPKKGSISARTDTDISKYDDYQKSAITDFKSAKHYLPSRGTSLPDKFVNDFVTIVSDFVSDKNVTKAAQALGDLTLREQATFITTWSF